MAEQGGCQSCKSNTPAPTGPSCGVGGWASTAVFWTWGHGQGGPQLGTRRPWAGEPPSPGLVTTPSMMSDGKGVKAVSPKEDRRCWMWQGWPACPHARPSHPMSPCVPAPLIPRAPEPPPEHHHHPLHQKWGHQAGDHRQPEWQVAVGKGEGRAPGANDLC